MGKKKMYVDMLTRNPLYLLWAVISGGLSYFFIKLFGLLEYIQWDLHLYDEVPFIFELGLMVLIAVCGVFGLICVIAYFGETKNKRLYVNLEDK